MWIYYNEYNYILACNNNNNNKYNYIQACGYIIIIMNIIIY